LGTALISIGQRGKRTDRVHHDIVTLENLTVIAFHRPDGQQDIAVNRKALFDALEPWPPFFCHALADSHGMLIHAVVDIVPDRLVELRLKARFAQYFRIGRIDTSEGAVECRW